VSWDAARAALELRLSVLPGINWALVALPNADFDPAKVPANQSWMKVSFLPAGADPEMAGKDHEKGIYQVSLMFPAGTGLASALQAAQAVIDHFKRQNLSGVQCGVPTLGPQIQEPEWLHIPVSIPFQCL
jgi:hypothetical protein